MDRVFLTTPKELIDHIIKGKVDIGVLTEITSKIVLKNDFPNHKLTIHPVPLSHHYLYHFLHSKNKKYIPKLNQIIHSMKYNGEIDRIESRFMKEN